MEQKKYFDVFISFNSRDREMATDVYEFLENNGVICFFSDERLKGEPSFVQKINEALSNSNDFLLITSSIKHIMPVTDDNFEGSDWVAGEIEKFIIANNNRTKKGQRKGKLVSFRKASVSLEELPLDFQKDSTAIVYSDNITCWDLLLGCFQNLGKKAETFSDIAFCQDWIDTQQSELNEMKMNLSSNDVQFDRITDIYVSLPIDLAISIEVENMKVVSISDGDTLPSFTSINESKYFSFQNSINNMIAKGMEYRYQDIDVRPKILAPVWTNGIKQNYWVLNAIDAIASNDKTVVIGEPGLGKSTLLKYLAIMLSNQYYKETNILSQITLSDEFYAKKFFPIYIEIRDCISWIGEQDCDKYGINSIALYICKRKLGKMYYYCESKVIDILKQRCVFIMDGLDEIASSDYNKHIICSILNDIERESPESKIVLSCRDRDYSSWDISGLKIIELQLMDRRTMYKLVEKVFVSHRKNMNPNQLFELLDSMNVDEKLSGNPLFLSLMANLYLKGEGGFPKNKSSIIKDSITLLLERKCNDLLAALNCELSSVIETLEEIAFEMQNKNNGRELTISRREMNGIIGDHMENCSLANSIKFFKATAGVISSPDSSEFEFTHRHFQEFLCASYLNKMKTKDACEIIKQGLLSAPARWSETCLLYAEILHDDSRKEELWSLVNWLLKSIRGLSDTNQCWVVWYTSEIVASRNFSLLAQDDDFHDDRNDTVIDCMRDAIINVIEYNQVLPIKLRIECAETLGRIGDSRPGVGLIEGVPAHQWCLVDYEGKDFIMGVSEFDQRLIESQSYNNKQWGLETSFSREQPAKKIDINPFYMSKYETTNMQLLAFIEAKDGYINPAWWDWCRASVSFHEKSSSHMTKLKMIAERKKNSPATHVNFYEAVAYCKWLSYKLNTKIRMPTEGEWEYAARINGTIFTWGNQFDEDKCNSGYSGIGDLTPVGLFYSINSISQPCEMNGNAWEWCQSIFPSWNSDEETLATYDEIYNYIDTDEKYPLENDAMVAVRGGSFINPPALLRNTFRGRDKMGDYFYRQGFRVIKEISKHPYSAPIDISDIIQNKNKEKAGAGRELSKGDIIRIAYTVKQNGNIIEDNMLPENAIEIRIGAGELNEEIESYLLNNQASVGTTLVRDFQVCSIDANGRTKTETYNFFVFISDIK